MSYFFRKIVAKRRYRKRDEQLRASLLRVFPDANYNAETSKKTAIFPKCEVVFSNVPKNACSTTIVTLNYIETGAVLTPNQARQSRLGFSKYEDGEVGQIATYRRLLVTRDPYSRVLSAFLEKFSSEIYIQKYRPFDLTSSGFENFLCWLRDGALTINGHWNLQTNLMLLPLRKYTDVVRFENYSREMCEFLNSLSKVQRPATENELLKTANNHSVRADEKLKYFYSKKSIAIATEVYLPDFDALKYPVRG